MPSGHSIHCRKIKKNFQIKKNVKTKECVSKSPSLFFILKLRKNAIKTIGMNIYKVCYIYK